MHIGIDLGTTYSCVSYIDEEGKPQVIASSDGTITTPSVIWFDGKKAFVGKKANDRKITPTSPIFEFFKRDIGKPRKINSWYEIDGYYFGAMGMSSIILRKLKKEAFNFFKRKNLITPDQEEKNYIIPAVITVPAYFGDLQRHETRIAGYSAGLDVIAIINEPTAAALAYGTNLQVNKKILVFDLGGGTFDVTILEVRDGEGIVIASDGADQLGGKDWDDIIVEYLNSAFERKTGQEIPDDMGWEIQQKAMEAKFDLTENDQTTVIISGEDEDVEIILKRNDPEQSELDEFGFDMDQERPFFFEERSSNLLSLCRTICSRVLEKSHLNWGDIDDIVLAGGSCRMPMIPNMLDDLTGRRINRNIPGFSFDTAISIGASLYGKNKKSVKDVTSKTIGIEVKINGRPYIEHLIEKNKQLPIQIDESFKAEKNAVLKVYEGDSHDPDECILRGRLELENPEGSVKVTMYVNVDGLLTSTIEIPPNIEKELVIKTDDGDIDKVELKSKISDIRINL